MEEGYEADGYSGENCEVLDLPKRTEPLPTFALLYSIPSFLYVGAFLGWGEGAIAVLSVLHRDWSLLLTAAKSTVHRRQRSVNMTKCAWSD